MEQITLNNMALLRVISGLIEIGAAIIFLRIGRVDAALRLNALLGLIGPIVFLLVSVLGITVLAIRLSWLKIGLISFGIILVLIGTKN